MDLPFQTASSDRRSTINSTWHDRYTQRTRQCTQSYDNGASEIMLKALNHDYTLLARSCDTLPSYSPKLTNHNIFSYPVMHFYTVFSAQ
jgi:hypothetical protein